jgi:predicted nucleic acid-binding protein
VLGYHQLTPNATQYFNSVFSILPLLPVTGIVLNRAIKLRQQKKMTLGDSIVAATALCFNLELITRNTKDFNWIEGLICSNPIKPT